MIKPVLKTLSLAFVTLAAAGAAPASEQNPSLLFASMIEGAAPVVCSSQADIDRGWEYQQALLEARLAAKSTDVLRVPGAIITPPFPNFVPNRSDVPSLSPARKSARPANRTGRQSTRRAAIAKRT